MRNDDHDEIPNSRLPELKTSDRPPPSVEIQSLRTFMEVARSKSFTDPAPLLDVGQSSVTRRIEALEKRLGVALFQRSSEVVLTPQGETLLDYARKVIEAAQDCEEVASSLDKRTRLRVGFLPSHLGLAIHGIKALVSDRDDIRVDTEEAMTERIVARVRAGKLDLGIVYLTTGLASDIDVVRVAPNPFGLIVHKDHELTKVERLSLRELCDWPFALPSRPMRVRELLDSYFWDNRFVPQVALQTNAIATLLSAVRRSELVTILPATEDRRGLIKLKLFPPPPEQTTVLIRRKKVPLEGDAKTFVDAVLAHKDTWQGE
jgi:LysR family cyn operon transcriptional activator